MREALRECFATPVTPFVDAHAPFPHFLTIPASSGRIWSDSMHIERILTVEIFLTGRALTEITSDRQLGIAHYSCLGKLLKLGLVAQ